MSTAAVATTVLAYIPSPDRGVWMLGPIPIRAYALCIIAGIVVAVLWGERRFVARGGRQGTVTDVAVFAVPFGLVGGRLYHVMTDWQTYFGPGGDPLGALRIWEGGLGIWGAIALGGVGAWIGCRRHGVPLPFFADAVAPGIVVAQAIGRLGNWFNQELYGAPTTVPWGLEIYERVDPATGLPDALGGVALDHTPVEVVHPVFLYELLWNLAVAGLVVWADRRFRLGHGRAFALYVAGYTAGRFWIEQMRTDYATRVFGDIRINVVVSALVFAGAVLYIALVRKPREVLDGPAAAPEPVPAPPAGTGESAEVDKAAVVDQDAEVDGDAEVDKGAEPGGGEVDKGAEADKRAEVDEGVDLDKGAAVDEGVDLDKGVEVEKAVDVEKGAESGKGADLDAGADAAESADTVDESDRPTDEKDGVEAASTQNAGRAP